MSEPQGAQDRITAFLRREGVDDGWDEDYANEVAGLILEAARAQPGLDVERLTLAVQRAMTDTGKSVDYRPLAEAIAREYAAQQREGAGE